MKKTLSTIVLASALLLGTVAPVAANAATTSADPTSTGNTDTHVTMKAPDNIKNPVDPTNPTNPATNTDPTDPTSPANPDNNGATTSGPLTFLYVTKDMTFADTQSVISGNQPAIPVKSIQESTFMTGGDPNTNFVTEIGDSRGTNEGWTVNVSSSQMKTAGGDVLKGATVDFTGEGANTTITNSASTDGISAKNVSLATEGATNDSAAIYGASEGNGAGATAFQLDPKNISLNNVGVNAKAGTYNGSLTWALSNTPMTSDEAK